MRESGGKTDTASVAENRAASDAKEANTRKFGCERESLSVGGLVSGGDVFVIC